MCCAVSKELQREIGVLGFLLVAAYTCFISSFFAVFVPQKCANTYYVGTANATGVVPLGSLGCTLAGGTLTCYHDCTFAENTYVDIDPFNILVLVVNGISAVLMLAGFFVELHRERWMILHLDVDAGKADDNLAVDFKFVPSLEKRLLNINGHYFRVFVAITVVQVANVILSGFLIFSPTFYNGYRSITTFLTNFVLLAQRLSTSVLVSRAGYSKVLAQSINLVENMTFNVVTHEHVGASQRGGRTLTDVSGAAPGSARTFDVLGLRSTSKAHARFHRHDALERGTGV